MKKLLFVIFIITFASCDKEETTDKDPSTFLESMHNTVWHDINDPEYENVLIRFKNDVDSPLEIWSPYTEEGCYTYLDRNVKVIENSENVLTLLYNPNLGLNTTISYTVEGENIRFPNRVTVDSNGEETITSMGLLVKSTIKINNITICD